MARQTFSNRCCCIACFIHSAQVVITSEAAATEFTDNRTSEAVINCLLVKSTCPAVMCEPPISAPKTMEGLIMLLLQLFNDQWLQTGPRLLFRCSSLFLSAPAI